jgi:PilZ domain
VGLIHSTIRSGHFMAKRATRRRPELDINTALMASQRRYPRYPTNCPAICSLGGRGHDHQQWDVTIINASQGGFGLATDLPVPEGTEIVISVPQIGDFLGSVVWKNGERCGIQLLTEAGWLNDDEAKRLASGLSSVEGAVRKA